MNKGFRFQILEFFIKADDDDLIDAKRCCNSKALFIREQMRILFMKDDFCRVRRKTDQRGKKPLFSRLVYGIKNQLLMASVHAVKVTDAGHRFI